MLLPPCVRSVAQSCLTLCNAMDGSLPGSSVHRILQARILEWIAILYSRQYTTTNDCYQSFIITTLIHLSIVSEHSTTVVFNCGENSRKLCFRNLPLDHRKFNSNWLLKKEKQKTTEVSWLAILWAKRTWHFPTTNEKKCWIIFFLDFKPWIQFLK